MGAGQLELTTVSCGFLSFQPGRDCAKSEFATPAKHPCWGNIGLPSSSTVIPATLRRSENSGGSTSSMQTGSDSGCSQISTSWTGSDQPVCLVSNQFTRRQLDLEET